MWFVIEVIDQMDTGRFHRLSQCGGVGRQGYDPDMLLTLLVFAYACGERSSRRIERLCVDHVAFRVACGDDAPDHTRIARFRADHQDEFAEVFAHVLRLCARQGMGKFGTIAIDGTKIAANAAKGANRSPDTVRMQAARIAEDIVAEAAATDQARQGSPTIPGGRRTSSGPWMSWTVKTPNTPPRTPRTHNGLRICCAGSRRVRPPRVLSQPGSTRSPITGPGSAASSSGAPIWMVSPGRRPARRAERPRE